MAGRPRDSREHRLVPWARTRRRSSTAGSSNPYGRDWWGGVPQGWEDVTHTVRSGLCMTRDGFIAAYFYGTQDRSLAPSPGDAHSAPLPTTAVHLDMNQGHTGLELYRTDRAERCCRPLSGKFDGHWQTEGDVSDMPGYRFRGRRLVRNLQLMHFPRYITSSGARDYFYLLLRPLLPRAPAHVPGSRRARARRKTRATGSRRVDGEGPAAARLALRHRNDLRTPRSPPARNEDSRPRDRSDDGASHATASEASACHDRQRRTLDSGGGHGSEREHC